MCAVAVCEEERRLVAEDWKVYFTSRSVGRLASERTPNASASSFGPEESAAVRIRAPGLTASTSFIGKVSSLTPEEALG